MFPPMGPCFGRGDSAASSWQTVDTRKFPPLPTFPGAAGEDEEVLSSLPAFPGAAGGAAGAAVAWERRSQRQRDAGIAVSVSGGAFGRVSGGFPRDSRRHRSLEGSWERFRVSAVRAGDRGRSRAPVPPAEARGGLFPGPLSPPVKVFCAQGFGVGSNPDPVKPEIKQLPPRSSFVLPGPVTKPHPKGKFPCPARCAGSQGREAALSWNDRCAGLLQHES